MYDIALMFYANPRTSHQTNTIIYQKPQKTHRMQLHLKTTHTNQVLSLATQMSLLQLGFAKPHRHITF